ncbi:hypothetical protein [Thermogymnomonas acidicola]|uniref:hypothetical protein n=1 Tax=Thermogymnomonas acidicola TaxID=399579 RepID=UPI001396B840|nr:hypothetical protein [Thermogymnomonas acidicola]
MPEDYELALGITGIHGRGSSRYVLNRSDFVMALGGPGSVTGRQRRWTSSYPQGPWCMWSMTRRR